MKCPTCGSKARVVTTRNVNDHLVRRYKVCLAVKCGVNFTSYEVYDDRYFELMDAFLNKDQESNIYEVMDEYLRNKKRTI